MNNIDIYGIQELVETDGILFLSYGGFLSQTLIQGMTEILEAESSNNNVNIGISNNIFTVFIELSQNIMNYSKNKTANDNSFDATGLMLVTKDSQKNYHIHSQNVISLSDKEKIEVKLLDIKSLDRDGIKKRYRELRRSGQGLHKKGAGIGFYEVAKKSDNIEYSFKKINENKFYFHLKVTIITSK